ncbi:YbaK/proline--tRNA ligase associated domain protein [Marvinbryantia formatexigens DSM 14469]|uniref:YbaK/proline--tRNA ligase associated domain protein n=1 Tax=Marvinbryantia formatexigens DSM 14469 TaxID=478749 RepID=C6LI75_9FIRM|nr:YbaK/EbsC family protein [Marvinbryantia formatexigens]EET59730.1 YbaK/proline--tRNA ligase associated domain protein [Marvinbryantia formatexigens DSM 14469]UWO26623.1 YbaK/EbsC family protein [Marvinbryantia formatexigens DSM 14469]SDG46780.1 Cys-tRNA(Pro) deacylase, prolyl-tRNA editing enzyme YbaK/EbsC [Marvinbryantia formatexigens]
MSLKRVQEYLEKEGISDRLKVFHESSATVELAAQALGCEPARIAKTMSFLLGDEAILIVTAGDVKVDNKKFKEQFHQKAKMIPGDLVEEYIGHAPGGVCPFAIKEHVPVYMDVSLKRFEIVYPAGGDAHSAVELTPAELERYSHSCGWVDVCKVREAV